MFNSNFDLVLQIDGQGVRVAGTSSAIPNASLVMRRVTLQQNGKVAEGKTDFGRATMGSRPCAAGHRLHGGRGARARRRDVLR